MDESAGSTGARPHTAPQPPAASGAARRTAARSPPGRPSSPHQQQHNEEGGEKTMDFSYHLGEERLHNGGEVVRALGSRRRGCAGVLLVCHACA